MRAVIETSKGALEVVFFRKLPKAPRTWDIAKSEDWYIKVLGTEGKYVPFTLGIGKRELRLIV